MVKLGAVPPSWLCCCCCCCSSCCCSGTDLESRSGGSMHGSFQMAVLDPQKLQDDASWLRTFDATIAPFKFVPPRVEGSG